VIECLTSWSHPCWRTESKWKKIRDCRFGLTHYRGTEGTVSPQRNGKAQCLINNYHTLHLTGELPGISSQAQSIPISCLPVASAFQAGIRVLRLGDSHFPGPWQVQAFQKSILRNSSWLGYITSLNRGPKDSSAWQQQDEQMTSRTEREADRRNIRMFPESKVWHNITEFVRRQSSRTLTTLARPGTLMTVGISEV